MNKCTINFEFEFGMIDNRHMNMTIQNQDNLMHVVPHLNNKATASMEIALPTEIKMTFFGKNPEDTCIDSQGNITQDMYVKILKIDFDGFDLNEIFLHQKIKLHTEHGSEITTSYVGFNGSIVLNFPESNVFTQYLSCCNI